MNIFYLDKDLKLCAECHVDKHVVKMLVEHAQLLSTAVRMSDIDAGYKISHKNHPCALWTRESLSNWKWLVELSYYLNEEYKFRYNAYHTSQDHKSWTVIASLPNPDIDDIGLTPFKLVMPDKYKVDCPIQSYRNYYIGDKQKLAKWKGRKIPDWYIKE